MSVETTADSNERNVLAKRQAGEKSEKAEAVKSLRGRKAKEKVQLGHFSLANSGYTNTHTHTRTQI